MTMPIGLQTAVDRYATALAVPRMLEQLHPRKQGNPGNAGALAPAIVLTSISAFEGFVEEFLAVAASLQGQSFAQIAKFVTMNNPTVDTFETKIGQLIGTQNRLIAGNRSVITVWDPPAIGASTWIAKTRLNWNDAKQHADGWMQVRHCLTHGLVRGFRPEIWPGPLRGNIHASSVLRPGSGGRYSLSLHGAESCGHIYRSAAQFLADVAVSHFGWSSLDWSKVPDFDI